MESSGFYDVNSLVVTYRQGHPIVATTTLKEAEINGLKEIIQKEVHKDARQTADRAINDLQAQLDVSSKDKLADHKRDNTRDHSDIRKEIKTSASL